MVQENIEYIDDFNAKVSIKTEIYPLNIIYSSAHILTDKAYFLLDGNPEKTIIVQITKKEKKQDLKHLVGAFCNELINFEVNSLKSKESLDFRNMIVEKIKKTNFTINQKENDSET